MAYIGAIQVPQYKKEKDMPHECEKDLNGHFVPTDKFDKDNLKNTQESICEDFSL